MAFNAQGQWEPEDDSVAPKLTGLMGQNSPLMQQAKTAGLQQANKRGLLNSSMAVGAAQNEGYRAALPIASQEAAQVAQKNLAKMGQDSSEGIARMNIIAHDREKATAAVTAMQNIYASQFQAIAGNEALPADARDRFLTHLSAMNDSNLQLIEQLYNIDLDWASPSAVA